YAVALPLLRFPYAFPLALLGGLLEFVPVVGWTSTLAVIIGGGIVDHSQWTWMAALLLVWCMVQGYAVMPRILGHELKIHPLAAIFSVLVGAELGGIVGIYLAVPIAAALRVILRMHQEEPSEPVHDPCSEISVAGPLPLADAVTN